MLIISPCYQHYKQCWMIATVFLLGYTGEPCKMAEPFKMPSGVGLVEAYTYCIRW